MSLSRAPNLALSTRQKECARIVSSAVIEPPVSVEVEVTLTEVAELTSGFTRTVSGVSTEICPIGPQSEYDRTSVQFSDPVTIKYGEITRPDPITGCFVYISNEEYTGIDMIKYFIRTNECKIVEVMHFILVELPSTLDFVVNPVNPLKFITKKNEAITVDLLEGDERDIPVHADTLIIQRGPTLGEIINHGDGTVTWTPPSGFTGAAAIVFTFEDSEHNPVEGFATFCIDTRDLPIKSQISPIDVVKSVAPYGKSVTTNLLDNAVERHTSVVTSSLKITSGPGAGKALNGGDGTVTWYPPERFSGSTGLEFQFLDDKGNTILGNATFCVDTSCDRNDEFIIYDGYHNFIRANYDGEVADEPYTIIKSTTVSRSMATNRHDGIIYSMESISVHDGDVNNPVAFGQQAVFNQISSYIAQLKRVIEEQLKIIVVSNAELVKSGGNAASADAYIARVLAQLNALYKTTAESNTKFSKNIKNLSMWIKQKEDEMDAWVKKSDIHKGDVTLIQAKIDAAELKISTSLAAIIADEDTLISAQKDLQDAINLKSYPQRLELHIYTRDGEAPAIILNDIIGPSHITTDVDDVLYHIVKNNNDAITLSLGNNFPGEYYELTIPPGCYTLDDLIAAISSLLSTITTTVPGEVIDVGITGTLVEFSRSGSARDVTINFKGSSHLFEALGFLPSIGDGNISAIFGGEGFKFIDYTGGFDPGLIPALKDPTKSSTHIYERIQDPQPELHAAPRNAYYNQSNSSVMAFDHDENILYIGLTVEFLVDTVIDAGYIDMTSLVIFKFGVPAYTPGTLTHQLTYLGNYNIFSIDGAGSHHDPGDPVLPETPVNLLLEWTGLVVTPGGYLLGSYAQFDFADPPADPVLLTGQNLILFDPDKLNVPPATLISQDDSHVAMKLGTTRDGTIIGITDIFDDGADPLLPPPTNIINIVDLNNVVDPEQITVTPHGSADFSQYLRKFNLDSWFYH